MEGTPVGMQDLREPHTTATLHPGSLAGFQRLVGTWGGQLSAPALSPVLPAGAE